MKKNFSGKLKKGLSDGQSYSTSQNSKELLHLTERKALLPLTSTCCSCFQLLQSDGRQREGNHHHLLLTSVDKQGLPEWLERSGAPEAIEVGADLRGRYDKLKLDLGWRAMKLHSCWSERRPTNQSTKSSVTCLDSLYWWAGSVEDSGNTELQNTKNGYRIQKMDFVNIWVVGSLYTIPTSYSNTAVIML